MDSAGSHITLNQRQRQRIQQAQLRYVRMLEMNPQELEDDVARELEENPALEATRGPESSVRDETPYYRRHISNRSADDDRPDFAPADYSESLYDVLTDQLAMRNLPEPVMRMAIYIINSLDSDGLLRRRLDSLIDDIAFNHSIEVPREVAERALAEVRSLEPPGIGASDIRDCLLMQLKVLPESRVRDNAIRILESQYEAFTMKHSHRIVSGLKISEKDVKAAVDLIRTLNPRPGASLGSSVDAAPPIVPDFIVSNDEGVLTVALNNRLPELRISETFSNAVERMELNKKQREKRRDDKKFITFRYNDAKQYIEVLAQRQETLFAVMTAIVEMQREYFLTEDDDRLKAMNIKDIAARTGYDMSVISRSTANKYVATDTAIIPVRHLFSGELGEDGEQYTNRQVENEIKRLVDGEDKRHPLSDERIREALVEAGYDVSRRTVSKYRDRMKIPVARLRKDM